MAITISGENNNDRILASDGVIDQISGINIVGLITASHINVGSNIQLGNAGIITATTFVGNVTGNINNTTLLLQTGGYERLRIDSGGRVKIGTTSNKPAADNEPGIVFGDNTAGTATKGIASFCANGAAPLLLTRRVSDGNVLGIADDAGTKGLLRVTSNDLVITAIEELRFSTGAGHVERMRLTNAGRLGIGLGGPSSALHVKSSSGTQAVFESTGSDNASIQFQDSTTTDSIIVGALNNDLQIRCDPGNIVFKVANNTEKVRIDSSGRLLLGTTTEGFAEADDFTINSADHGGMTIRTPTNKEGNIAFSDTTSGTGEYSGLIRYRHNSDDLGLWTASNLRLLIDSNGYVGMRESSPHLYYSPDLVVKAAADAGGITIRSAGTSHNNYLMFADGNSGDARYDGYIKYNHSSRQLEFAAAATVRLLIASDGKVGINDNSPSEMLDVGGAVQASQGFKIAGHPVVTYASFTDISGGSYATRLGSTGTSTLRHTQIYTGGSHQATFDGVNSRLGLRTTKPQTTLNVIGAISTGRNVARELGTIINVSSEHHSSRAGSNVINGRKNHENQGTDWLAAGGSRTNANLTIDLGSSISCDRFVIYNQNEYQDSQREVKRFTLEGSNDNSNWTTILDDNAGCSNGHEPNPGWSFRMPADRDDDEEGVSYRYWRFTMKDFHGSDSYGGIMELELYQTSNTNGEVESEVSTHSLVATDVSAEIVRANGQPAFSVARSSTQNYSANDTIIFDDDTGAGYFQTGTTPHCNYYNTSNGIFTAPMSGVYFFTTTVLVQNSTGNYDLIIKTSARDFYCAPGRKASNAGSTSWSTSGTVYLAFGGDCIVYLTKGATAQVQFSTFGGGQIYGSGSWTRFAGYLLG